MPRARSTSNRSLSISVAVLGILVLFVLFYAFNGDKFTEGKLNKASSKKTEVQLKSQRSDLHRKHSVSMSRTSSPFKPDDAHSNPPVVNPRAQPGEIANILSFEIYLTGTGKNSVPVLKKINAFKAIEKGDEIAEQDFRIVNGGVLSGIKRGADFNGRSIQGAEWMQINYEPSVGCVGEIRIGDSGDGGKWICPSLIRKHNCSVLSVGIGGNAYKDTSFERVLAKEYGCEVHAFDHTQSYAPGIDYYTYHKLGLGPSVDRSKMLTTLPEMAAFFSRPCCTIVKLDVEGTEFETFAKSEENREFLGKHALQVQAELHFREHKEGATQRFDVPREMRTLVQSWHDQGLRIFHKEPNIQYSNGHCTEFSYVNAHMLQLPQPV
mmetsp:Transcript_37819/g.52518  ORF Transcript_37819/g.52518 Transcript_37819/m.52518 type:complete len:379 (+) Transcript_37819:443-1579(+)|eukprot:CAMPEP_0196594774 /NCGR_PEP_ID=MMETSP1081-20130531/79262_1 /TAXON_ID=36882 /ORGANISM="Pyramimonas amylifera, Strain CCMP720" /LENGTH=378 /DNA_ID=CAMNT_0041919129 /DNA_START=439 /DNA_END=1575 /DNA_ORIENTATION=-